MKKLRWQLLIVILALAAIALILLGQQPNVLPPNVQNTPQPIAGGLYTEGLVGSPSRLNPLLDFYNQPDRDIDHLLYSSLIHFDERGIPNPDLAESYGITQDGTTYTFSIRQNARWHDGEPVTSQDIIFTIELMRDPNMPVPQDLRDLWNDIEVEAINDSLIQFHLPEPLSPFLDYLTFGILPEHLLGSLTTAEIVDAPFNLQPIGSGPYRFSQFLVENDQIVGVELIAFEQYHFPRAFIDKLVFRYYPDSQTALTAFQNGEVNGVSQITSDVLPTALAEPGLSLYTSRLPQLTLVFFNLDSPRHPFFQELAVRQALMHALNRQRLVNEVLGGQAILANGPIFPGTWAYLDVDELPAYDVDAGIDLLKAAEYTIPAEGGDVRAKGDEFLRFTLLHPDDALHTQIAEIIQSSWAQIGVEVELEALPYPELVEALTARDYAATLVDLNLTRSPDPDPYPFWHQAQITGGQNYAQWDDRVASEYLEQARITLDLTERARLYRNFQVRFARELPALPLYYPVYTYAVSSEVQGVRVGPLFDPSDRLSYLPQWFLQAVLGNTPVP
ncbi:MAG: peptide ABC transporter substrate-binding protein [Anaerolineales bacterium]|nr:peptide ABC transporter substrate-binding protein [Anaerolineales bacterium]